MICGVQLSWAPKVDPKMAFLTESCLASVRLSFRLIDSLGEQALRCSLFRDACLKWRFVHRETTGEEQRDVPRPNFQSADR